jgi:hypothetical protein
MLFCSMILMWLGMVGWLVVLVGLGFEIVFVLAT